WRSPPGPTRSRADRRAARVLLTSCFEGTSRRHDPGRGRDRRLGHTRRRPRMTGKIYHPEDKHPDEWQDDLNPDASKGVNYHPVGPHPEKDNPRTAYDVKELHRRMRDYTDDVLKQIPILPE